MNTDGSIAHEDSLQLLWKFKGITDVNVENYFQRPLTLFAKDAETQRVVSILEILRHK